jgi:hypothetical protein
MSKIEIFILTNGNRSRLLNETVNSALSIIVPHNCSLAISVSVNSGNEVSLDNDLIRVITNKVSDNLFKHMQDCIEFTDADFVVFFHDDDLFLPNYLQVLTKHIYADNCVAVGGNSIIFSEDRWPNKIAFNRLILPKFLKSKHQISAAYLECAVGAAALPSYLYRRTAIGEALVKLNSFYTFYRYSDIQLLILLLENKQNIKILPHCVMCTRWHASNDTKSINALDLKYKLSLLESSLCKKSIAYLFFQLDRLYIHNNDAKIVFKYIYRLFKKSLKLINYLRVLLARLP